RHTRFSRDWSSDVCSSDLIAERLYLDPQERAELLALCPRPKTARRGLPSGEMIEPNYLQLTAQQFRIAAEWEHFAILSLLQCSRSEERRVVREGRSRD